MSRSRHHSKKTTTTEAQPDTARQGRAKHLKPTIAASTRVERRRARNASNADIAAQGD